MDGNQDQAQVIIGLEAELTRKEREISQLTLDISALEDKNTLEIQQLNRQLICESSKTLSFKILSYYFSGVGEK